MTEQADTMPRDTNSTSEAGTPPELTPLIEILDLYGDLADALQACASASACTAGRHRANAMD